MPPLKGEVRQRKRHPGYEARIRYVDRRAWTPLPSGLSFDQARSHARTLQRHVTSNRLNAPPPPEGQRKSPTKKPEGVIVREWVKGWYTWRRSLGLTSVGDDASRIATHVLEMAVGETGEKFGDVPMADADHSPTFWASVASNFKSNGSVIFELFNEPYVGNNGNSTADWKCWRDGGSACSESFAIAGMQSLLYAVRGTGATNLVLLGGINYSNALGQWAAYKPSDTKSSSDSTAINNLAVAWHVYAGNWCESNVSPYTCNAAAYSAQAGTLAQSYPIVATETGDNDTPCSSANSTFVTDFMTWMDQHGQGYTAWNYGAWGGDCSDYSLVTNEETGAATSYGAPIKTHLLGR